MLRQRPTGGISRSAGLYGLSLNFRRRGIDSELDGWKARWSRPTAQLYADAAGYAARVTRHDDRVFFQALFAEEQEHAQELLRWIQELERSPGEPLPQQSSRSRRM